MRHKWLLTLVVLVLTATTAYAQDVVGSPITPWQPGMLEIHQISTGRGNAGLFIFPDGTTLLVDAGEFRGGHPARPDDSRGAGEWIVRYVRHALRHDPDPALDYALLTHFHEDHMGDVRDGMPVSPHGYTLTGITRVGDELKIGTLLDRGWPDYSNVAQPDQAMLKNYRAFLTWQTEHNGLRVERFVPGRNDQIVLVREADAYPQFELRNVGANGEIWTGTDTATEHRMPPLDTIPREEWPDENVFSISFRLTYGGFRYFSGGDIPGIRPDSPAWYDMETPVAKVVGPVDAAILNHHGYVDTMNEFFVSTLSARIWTISVWDPHHPVPAVWERLQSEQLYPGPRSVFATDVQPDTRVAIPDIAHIASDQGHIVLRVAPGGGQYSVTIVDDRSESHNVTRVFGPYESRGSAAGR